MAEDGGAHGKKCYPGSGGSNLAMDVVEVGEDDGKMVT